MPLKPAAIKEATDTCIGFLDTLGKRLQTLRNLPPNSSEDSLRQSHAAVTSAQTDFEAAADDLAALFGTTSTSSFSSFLSDVGSAAVDAQHNLDLANRRLIANAQAQGLPPSGVFQLPKLTGEVKFAFSQKASKKLGLVFYSRGTSEETRNEQSLKFEIVSVPPSPELLQKTSGALLNFQPLLSAATRDPVMQVLTSATTFLTRDGRPHGPGYKEITEFVAKEPDATLLFAVPAEKPGDDRRYIAIYAAGGDDPGDTDKVGIWEVNLDQGSVTIVWKFNSAALATENITPLRRWVRQLALQQQALF